MLKNSKCKNLAILEGVNFTATRQAIYYSAVESQVALPKSRLALPTTAADDRYPEFNP